MECLLCADFVKMRRNCLDRSHQLLHTGAIQQVTLLGACKIFLIQTVTMTTESIQLSTKLFMVGIAAVFCIS